MISYLSINSFIETSSEIITLYWFSYSTGIFVALPKRVPNIQPNIAPKKIPINKLSHSLVALLIASPIRPMKTRDMPKEIKNASMKDIHTDDERRFEVIKWLKNYLEANKTEQKAMLKNITRSLVPSL